MIRKAVIVVLVLLSLGTAHLLALSFSDSSPLCRSWDVIDTADTLVIARANRGGLCVTIGRMRRSESSLPPLERHEDRIVCPPAVSPRAWRKIVVPLGPLSSPSFREQTNLARFGLAVPPWDVHDRSFAACATGYLFFPLWCPLLVFAAYPTVVFIRCPLRRHRRRKRGLCIHCGYNLTGLPGPRCPECGEPT